MNGFLYSQYRANLHRGYAKDKHKPTTRKGRELHRLERWFYMWPLHACIRWAQHRSKYPANTTQTIETPEGVFFNARVGRGEETD